MKDFDEVRAQRQVRPEEERSFKLGGEQFTIRDSVRADTLAAGARVTDKSSVAEDVDAMDELILGFLDEADHERYLELRRRERDPVTFYDLVDVAQWMVQVNTGRPTVQPSPSGAGEQTTPPPLTAVSSPPPAAQAG